MDQVLHFLGRATVLLIIQCPAIADASHAESRAAHVGQFGGADEFPEMQREWNLWTFAGGQFEVHIRFFFFGGTPPLVPPQVAPPTNAPFIHASWWRHGAGPPIIGCQMEPQKHENTTGAGWGVRGGWLGRWMVEEVWRDQGMVGVWAYGVFNGCLLNELNWGVCWKRCGWGHGWMGLRLEQMVFNAIYFCPVPFPRRLQMHANAVGQSADSCCPSLVDTCN